MPHDDTDKMIPMPIAITAEMLQDAHQAPHAKRQRWLATLSPHVLPDATCLIHHDDWRVREQAVLILHHHAPRGQFAYTQALVMRLLQDEVAQVRVRSAFALARVAPVGDAPACDALIMSLQDADDDVRYRALYALSCIGDHPATRAHCFEAVVACHHARGWYVRHARIKALHRLDARRAEPYLRASCDDPMRRVRETAKFLLA